MSSLPLEAFPVLTLFIFLAGLCIGSFLNVCIWRIPREESIVFPGSHCPACNHALAPRDNIPLLSWLVLNGKCRYCKAHSSTLATNGGAIEFVKDAYRHCKAIMFLGGARSPVLTKAALPTSLPDGDSDPGLVLADGAAAASLDTFVAAIAAHRAFARETDPPLV